MAAGRGRKKTPNTPEELLDALYEAEDPKDIRAIAGKLLLVEPENADALYFLGRIEEEPERAADLLSRCAASIRKRKEAKGENVFDCEDEELPYGLALRELAFAQLDADDWRGVVASADELRGAGEGSEWEFLGTAFRFVALLLSEQYAAVVEEAIADGGRSAVAAHAKAIALFEMRASEEEVRRALWDAFRIAPELPFFILDYWEAPDEEEADDETLEAYAVATILEYAWARSEARVEMLSQATTLFGYLTDRLPDEMADEIEENGLPEEIESVVEDANRRIEELYRKEVPDLDEVDRIAIETLSRLPLVIPE